MGAGVGAAAAIDNEPSPRRAAIEKAQAELRREVAVREERRRELEFLEKGGEPLDFFIAATSALPPFSVTDPLADPLVLSEVEGGYALNPLANGDSLENSVDASCFLGIEGGDRCVGDDDASAASESLASPWEGSFRAPRTGSSSLRSQVDVSLKRESESSSGARATGKDQTYFSRRNRQRINRFGNGYPQTREVEKASGGSSTPLFELNGLPAVSVVSEKPSKGNESMVEKNVQPLQLQLPLLNTSSNKASLRTGKANEHQEDPSLSLVNLSKQSFLQYVPDANAGVDLGKPTLSRPTVDDCVTLPRSSDVKDSFCTDSNVQEDWSVGADLKKLDSLSLVPCLEENVGEREGSALSQPSKQVSCNTPATVEKGGPLFTMVKDESTAIMVRVQSSVSSQPGSHAKANDCKNKHPIQTADSLAQRVLDRGTTMPSNHVRDSTPVPVNEKRFVQLEGPGPLQVTSMSLDSSEYRSNNARKTTSIASTDALNLTKSDRVMSNEKVLEPTQVQVKVEDVSEPETRVSGVETEADSSHGVKSVRVVSLPQEEVKIEAQSTPVSAGSNRTGFRTPSSLTASNKFPGVLLPWEKEKDPNVIAEAERHKANLSANARKAHEEYILEEAGLIQGRKSDAAVWEQRKPEPELMRRKSHWDFLLEEMAWMANDFMQERLWKMASATQLCRWIAELKGQAVFQETDLQQRQKKIAHILANSVKDFWRRIELTLCKDKEKGQVFLAMNSQGVELLPTMKDDGEAVPMDVDQAPVGEASTQQLLSQKWSKRALPVQVYAKRFLRESRGSDLAAQAEAPSTPDRTSESSSVLDLLWEDQFPEERICYTVPIGAFAIYRLSVETQRASVEADYEQTLQEHNAALAEAEAQAAAEAVATLEFIVDDGQSLTGLSSPLKEVRGEGDGAQFCGLPHSSIAKKKRKNILKSTPKVEGFSSSGLPRPSPFVEGFGIGGSLPSPVVTAKRSLPSGSTPTRNLVGSIPTKRMRSGTARQRPLATASPSSFPSSAGITSRIFSSGALNSNHEEVNNVPDTTVSLRTEGVVVATTSTTASKNVIGGGGNNTVVSSKSKKKKKTKHFSGALGSTFKGDGAASGNTASALRPIDSEHNSVYDHTKRKVDQLHGGSLESNAGGIGLSAETTETPSAQGQPLVKKAKLSKQTSDIISDAATAATTIAAAQLGSVVANTSSSSKLLRQNSTRDRNRKSRSNKVSVSQPPGIGIPWTTIEDQAILALVHDLGPNWELVSDVLSSSSQLKGIYRRPKQCKERHKALIDRLSVGEGGDSPEDPCTSQPHPSNLPGIPKGSARVLLQRLQGPMEEDTLKVHLDHIVRVVTKFKGLKPQAEEQKPLPTHPSHQNTASQFCTNGLAGGFPNPIELIMLIREAEKKRDEELAGLGQSYQMPGTHSPSVLPTGPGVRHSNGMPGMPVAGSLHMGGASVVAPSNAAANAARDVHRLAAMRSFSPEDAQRVRYAQAMAARRLPVSGASVTAGLPMMALPNPNDCAVPMLAAGNSVGMMGGLSRGMSLSRAGLPGMGSPGVSGMSSPSLGTMLPPGGIGMVGAAGSSVGPAGVPSQVNSMRRPRDQMVRPVRTSEEQRLLIQELQHQAAQGSTEAQTHLTTLERDPLNPLISAPSQNFPTSQLPSQQQHQLLATRMFKERQQLQQQHKQRLLQQQLQHQPASHSHSLPLQQPQLQHALSQQHLVLPQQAHMQQHQHLLPQHQLALQKQQQMQQPGLPLPSSPMQPLASSSMPLPSNHHHQQQHQTLSQSPSQSQQQSQTPGQVPQLSVQSNKVQQPKQPHQKHQHLQQQQQQQPPRGSKAGAVRGSMMMQQPLPSQAGHSSMLPGNVALGNQISQQLPGQAVCHSMPGQRSIQPQVPMSMGKQLSQGNPQGMTAQAGPVQQAQQKQALTGGSASPGSMGQQQKVLQQPSQMALPHKQPQASPSLHPSHSQQSASTPGLPAHQQQLSPSSQQSQTRRQPQQQTQPQSGQRRLQQRQPGPNSGGVQVSGQHLVKNGTSVQGQISPQMVAQSGGHVAYPLGTSMASSMSMMGAPPGAPVITPLGNSSPGGVHSPQWKPGQNVSPMSTGIYNLTRSGNSGTAMPSTVHSAGMHMTPHNGSSGMASSSIHGLNISGLPQSNQQSTHLGQNVGMVLGASSRPIAASAQGAQRSLQQQQHGNLPISVAMSAAGQVKPPLPASSSVAMMPVSSLGSSTAAGISQTSSMAFQGSSSPGAVHSATMGSTVPKFGAEPRQLASTSASVPQKSGVPPAATKTANSASSGEATSSPASVICPSTAANPTVTE